MPLELLVEREGSDSHLGATRATLRVPSFIDDVISAMRQMGESKHLRPGYGAFPDSYSRYVHRRHLP